MTDDREQRITHMVQSHQGMLLRLCYVYLRDMEQARDVTQETFLRAYRALDAFRDECSEKTWLIRIAINICRSMQRSAWFRHVDRRITPDDLPLSDCVSVDDERIDLMCSIMQLPVKLREVVLLYYWQDMTVEEIARMLGMAHSSVSARLKKARETLHGLLDGRDCDD